MFSPITLQAEDTPKIRVVCILRTFPDSMNMYVKFIDEVTDDVYLAKGYFHPFSAVMPQRSDRYFKVGTLAHAIVTVNQGIFVVHKEELTGPGYGDSNNIPEAILLDSNNHSGYDYDSSGWLNQYNRGVRLLRQEASYETFMEPSEIYNPVDVRIDIAYDISNYTSKVYPARIDEYYAVKTKVDHIGETQYGNPYTVYSLSMMQSKNVLHSTLGYIPRTTIPAKYPVAKIGFQENGDDVYGSTLVYFIGPIGNDEVVDVHVDIFNFRNAITITWLQNRINDGSSTNRLFNPELYYNHNDSLDTLYVGISGVGEEEITLEFPWKADILVDGYSSFTSTLTIQSSPKIADPKTFIDFNYIVSVPVETEYQPKYRVITYKEVVGNYDEIAYSLNASWNVDTFVRNPPVNKRIYTMFTDGVNVFSKVVYMYYKYYENDTDTIHIEIDYCWNDKTVYTDYVYFDIRATSANNIRQEEFSFIRWMDITTGMIVIDTRITDALIPSLKFERRICRPGLEGIKATNIIKVWTYTVPVGDLPTDIETKLPSNIPPWIDAPEIEHSEIPVGDSWFDIAKFKQPFFGFSFPDMNGDCHEVGTSATISNFANYHNAEENILSAPFLAHCVYVQGVSWIVTGSNPQVHITETGWIANMPICYAVDYDNIMLHYDYLVIENYNGTIRGIDSDAIATYDLPVRKYDNPNPGLS